MYLCEDIRVRCNACGIEMIVPKENFLERSFVLEESGMGERIEHDFTYEGECQACGDSIEVMISAFEYPVGALEYVSKNTEGCEMIGAPNIEMEY